MEAAAAGLMGVPPTMGVPPAPEPDLADMEQRKVVVLGERRQGRAEGGGCSSEAGAGRG